MTSCRQEWDRVGLASQYSYYFTCIHLSIVNIDEGLLGNLGSLSLTLSLKFNVIKLSGFLRYLNR